MPRTLCEQIAAPLLELHRKTSSPTGMVLLEVIALAILAYGIASGNYHVVWLGVLGAVVSWYGFLLSGCERLLAAKEREIVALQESKIPR